jgi:hypothetical protein
MEDANYPDPLWDGRPWLELRGYFGHERDGIVTASCHTFGGGKT